MEYLSQTQKLQQKKLKDLDILRLIMDNTFVRQAIDQGLQCSMNPNSVLIEKTDF